MREREREREELVHRVVGAASLKFAGQAGSLETQGRGDVAQVQRESGGRSLSSSGDLSLFLRRSSIDLMKPLTLWRVLCLTQSLLI